MMAVGAVLGFVLTAAAAAGGSQAPKSAVPPPEPPKLPTPLLSENVEPIPIPCEWTRKPNWIDHPDPAHIAYVAHDGEGYRVGAGGRPPSTPESDLQSAGARRARGRPANQGLRTEQEPARRRGARVLLRGAEGRDCAAAGHRVRRCVG